MITINDLVKDFKELGLQHGDIVLVHSSYLSLGSVEGGVQGGPQTVIDTLLEVLGDSGTLIMPTFNFDFCKGKPWDVRSTPSHMGILTELVRKNPRSCRVFHPIHSFAIIGKLSRELCNFRYKGSFAPDSILGKLYDLDGKIMIIGLPYNESMTFFHYVEETIGVPYRFHKSFTGQVTDEAGKTYEDTFTMYVRDLERGVVTDFNPLGDILDQEGVVTISKIGNGLVRLMKAREVYPIAFREIKAHLEPGFHYHLEPTRQ